jgi:hypothetical protein
MATETAGSQDGVLATITRLVTVADGDTLYRDVYLRRAAELLSPIINEERFESARGSREELDKLLAQARPAVARQDWARVRDLGARAAGLQRSLAADKELLAAAEAVYGAPTVALDPLSPGLTSASKRWSNPGQARAEVVAALAELARETPAQAELYASRQRALEALALPGAATPGAKAGEPRAVSAEQALQALEQGDAAALQSFADTMLGKTEARPAAGEGAPATRGRIAAPAVLGEPLPEACVPKAKALGLERVESTFASPAMARAVSDFVDQYAVNASAAAHERAIDGVVNVMAAAESVSVPAEVAEVFAQTISLLALHLYVNSAGVRFLPIPAAREVLLVETHADGEEPVTPLLQALGLDRRRGLARSDIETRLRKNGARILAEQLGLDPLGFRIVCIPADIFMRLGGSRGWGKREEWTHFDGYQVLTGNRLRALVGGNARFGGLFDLCSISADDARDKTVVRFAVVRRERLGVRIG